MQNLYDLCVYAFSHMKYVGGTKLQALALFVHFGREHILKCMRLMDTKPALRSWKVTKP